MKFVEPSHFTDPDAAARKLVEIANAAEAVQDRIHIELPFPSWRHRCRIPRRYRTRDQQGLAMAA